MRNRLISSRLAAVGVLGLLLLNYPLLWLYLYLVWCALIAVLALIVHKAE